MINFIKKHALAILFIILFFASTAMYSKNLKTEKDLNIVQRTILEVSLPLQNLIHNVTSTISKAVDNYFFLVDTKKDNFLLKSEVSALRAQLDESKELEITNKRLRELLAFKETQENKIITAEVVSKGASTWLNTIIIDKGSNDGVFPGLAVVTRRGIIGHTIYTTNNYSQALLMIDKNSAIDVINQRSRARGVVRGYRNNLCVVDYLLTKDDVLADDVFITSGMDGIFPKGLRVGKAKDIAKSEYDLFQSVTLKPFVDFDKLEEVLIIIRQEDLLEEIKNIKEKR